MGHFDQSPVLLFFFNSIHKVFIFHLLLGQVVVVDALLNGLVRKETGNPFKVLWIESITGRERRGRDGERGRYGVRERERREREGGLEREEREGEK